MQGIVLHLVLSQKKLKFRGFDINLKMSFFFLYHFDKASISKQAILIYQLNEHF